MLGILLMNPDPDYETAPGRGGPVESLPPEIPLDLAAPAGLDEVPADSTAGAAPLAERLEFTIGRRETFYDALAARGVPHTDIMAVVGAAKPFRNLGKVKGGDRFWIGQHLDGGLERLGFDLDDESWAEYRRVGDGYEMEQGSYPVERREAAIAGRIERSLYESLQESGAPLQLAPKMNDVFGWEIDFNRDLREGDTFRVIYQEVWKNGRFLRTGPILAAECINRGKSHRAYRFADSEDRSGYYDADGRNLQKQLMRAPLEYSRISSGFSYRRFHPVLKRWMPHMGIDYAAPVGTPVWAAGDGVITEIGRKSGNGRYIRVRHTNQEYESWYLHLSRFASGMRRGARVSQGQVIGFVGATGYATGPHLDFRIQRNGSWVNPRTLKLPSAEPVGDGDRDAFVALVARWEDALSTMPEVCSRAPLWAVAEPAPPRVDPRAVMASMMRPPALPPLASEPEEAPEERVETGSALPGAGVAH
ncbi:MAG: peptidoglycan DD-metalloendopeptidase family protein [Candidatus Krumholzibacteriia bacterium]